MAMLGITSEKVVAPAFAVTKPFELAVSPVIDEITEFARVPPLKVMLAAVAELA